CSAGSRPAAPASSRACPTTRPCSPRFATPNPWAGPGRCAMSTASIVSSPRRGSGGPAHTAVSDHYKETVMQDMKDKVVLVTGGGTGLGAATSLGFARRGAHVIVNYANSADAAADVAKQCEALGVRAIAVQADVGDDSQCRALVERTLTEFGRLDTLINNAGTTKFADQSDLDALVAEDFQS